MSSRPGFRTDERSDAARLDSRIESLRLPPQSMDAEQAVLGGLMLAPDAYDRIADVVAEDDFYRRDHRLIFRAIRELSSKEKPFDVVTLGEWFQANELTDQIGGGGYLIELAGSTPSAANIVAYAQIVREKSVLRQLIQAGTEIVNDGFQTEGRSSEEILQLAEQKVFHIAEAGRGGKESIIDIRKAMREAFEILRERYENQGAVTGIPTGFAELDELTAGLQPSDLIIVAARPAMGKTTLALNIAEYAAMKSRKAVAVFSMEMSSSQLAFRLISAMGRVNATRLRTGQLEDEDWSRVNSAIRMLSDAKIFIDDTPALSPDELRSKARRFKREHDLGLVVVDYLQLMQVAGSSSDNRTNEISEISRGLKALAKELNVPVIALSQLNRGLESRTDKRPQMSDLRDSGAIEQDADVIMFIYRDEYYKKDSEDKGLAEIIIAKQRNGPTGVTKLRFFGEYTRFDNLARDAIGSFE